MRDSFKELDEADKDKVISLHISDTHFSHIPPPIWNTDKWYNAMNRYLKQLCNLMTDWGTPIFVAGDLLHTWKEPPELVNFLLKNMPQVYAVPGNHDLPNHQYEDVHRSAFGTLVNAGKVHLLNPDMPNLFQTLSNSHKKLAVYAFPCGRDVEPPHAADIPEGKEWLHVAIAHAYIWTKNRCFPGAPKKLRLARYTRRLEGYHAAFFGDNHKGFVGKAGDCNVLNCGTFMRRRSDEIGLHPYVGLLYESGMIGRHYLNTSKDEIHNIKRACELENLHAEEMEDLLATLVDLGEAGVNFKEAMSNFFKSNIVHKETRNIILEAMERRRDGSKS